MKKLLLLSLATFITVGLFAQNRAIVNPTVKNLMLKKPVKVAKDPVSQGSILQLPYSKVLVDEQIGETQYDLQSNATVDSRVFSYADGTVGATWTFGLSATTFPDRGTGYNYFDGSAWGPIPSARVESIRTGWPSYSSHGSGGEAVVAHNGTQLVLSKRATKGTGAWTESLIPYNTINPTWPRMVTSGNTIHIVAADDVTYQGVTDPLIYYRSQDGGSNWDVNQVIIPEIQNYIYGLGIDAYSWAEPQGNTIAFVAADNWTDMVLMKSTDGGDTWTKTVIFQHPYPNFNEATMLTPDTPYVSDGCHAVALDAFGNAHVAFGIMRVLNDDTTDGQTSYFPATDGLAYWKEGDATFTNLDPNVVYNDGKLIGWVLDLDGSDTLWDGLTDISNFAGYYTSQTSMPQITIADNNDIFVTFVMSVENMQAANGQFFNHIWARSLPYGQPAWTDFVQLNAGTDYDGIECVFPAMARKVVNDKLWISYQYDMEPGLAVRGDEDPYGTNYYMMISVDAADITKINDVVPLNGMVNIFPNPASDIFNVNFALNKDSRVKMNIYNSVGSIVKTDNLNVSKGATLQVNISDLPNGIYLARFETPKGTFTNKIVKN